MSIKNWPSFHCRKQSDIGGEKEEEKEDGQRLTKFLLARTSLMAAPSTRLEMAMVVRGPQMRLASHIAATFLCVSVCLGVAGVGAALWRNVSLDWH